MLSRYITELDVGPWAGLKQPYAEQKCEGMAGFPFCLRPEVLPQVGQYIEYGTLPLQSLAEAIGHLFCIPESDRTQMENVNTPERLTAARARLQ